MVARGVLTKTQQKHPESGNSKICKNMTHTVIILADWKNADRHLVEHNSGSTQRETQLAACEIDPK